MPLGLVHGDFQIANLLIDRDDNWLVIDWELTHVGDPREDLGWALLAGVTQPPDLIRCDEESFYAAYREASGLSEEQVNPATIDFFLLLASPTVFVSVIEQLALLARGETTGIAVAYMSPAVIGMHDVFMRTIKHAPKWEGPHDHQPTNRQLIEAVSAELTNKVAPTITDGSVKVVLDMALAVLAGAAVRTSNELAWMREEADAIEAVAARLAGELPEAKELAAALDAYRGGRPRVSTSMTPRLTTSGRASCCRASPRPPSPTVTRRAWPPSTSCSPSAWRTRTRSPVSSSPSDGPDRKP